MLTACDYFVLECKREILVLQKSKKLNGTIMGTGFQRYDKLLLKELFSNHEYQVETSKILFTMFDSDKNGTISVKEFLIGYIAHTITDLVERMSFFFDIWDSDRSNSINRSEAEEMWRISTRNELAFEKTSKLLKEYIVGIAFSKSSIFPRAHQRAANEKVVAGMQKLRPLFDSYYNDILKIREDHIKDFIDKIFQLADTDKNGQLSREEFVQFFSNAQFALELQNMSEELTAKRSEQFKQEKEDYFQKLLKEKVNENPFVDE